MESKVQSQKAVSLSSGESEFVAMVGCSEGLLIKHLWDQLTGKKCVMKVRSDSSAARAMVQGQGIGRVRHLDASLLWIQQKEKETQNRHMALLYMLKMVDSVGKCQVVRQEQGC